MSHPSIGRPRTRVAVAAGLTGLAGVLVAAGPTASAASASTLTAPGSAERNCHAGLAAGQAGVTTTTTTAKTTGLLQARLSGGAGDWDLAVFDRASSRMVAASAGLDSDELAEGFVRSGQQLVVQACRYAGGAGRAGLTVDVLATPAKSGEKVSVVEVATPTVGHRARLDKLGLDLTEHGTSTGREAVLYGAADVEKLRRAGLTYTVRIADLEARSEANRLEDERYAAAETRSKLPSGRTSYRHLADYNLEMKQLASRYPNLTRPITLPHRTVLGRPVHGIEITKNADNVADGKPIFANMGVHHAREWPSGESSMEFAYDLLTNYGSLDKTTELVDAARTIVIPIVNPDGFNVSREARRIGDFGLFDYEMKRKNCNPAGAPPEYRGGSCANNPAGRLRGTDLNRNYGGYWGGPGASPTWSSDTFRGVGPFSEPETRNIRDLVTSRQVTNLITNHTYSNLVLFSPGQFDTQPPEEVEVLEGLGARMAAHNGYLNTAGYNLYETSGTTEDFTYWQTGGLGYTFEIGPDEFHPPFYKGVVAEYLGWQPAAGEGMGGNRAAYYEMLRATVSSRHHATLTGTAPAGATLKVAKEFSYPTSPVVREDGTAGAPLRLRERISSTYRSDGGTFRWAVYPSTRPYVGPREGRDAVAHPQPAIRLPNPPGVPAENQGDPTEEPNETVSFTVQGPPRVDNGRFAVRIEWTDPNVDWDIYVLNAAGELVAASASGGTNFENAVMLNPPPGRYTVYIVNYEGGTTDDWTNGSVTFESPKPATEGRTEAWRLTCETADGAVSSRRVVVDRGQTARLGEVCG